MCTVTEQFPLDEKSGYSRKVIWQDERRTESLEDGTLRPQGLAPQNAHLFRTIGSTWIVTGGRNEQTMVNHLTGASTVLRWTDFQVPHQHRRERVHPDGPSSRALMRLGGAIAAFAIAGAGAAAQAADAECRPRGRAADVQGTGA